MNINIETIFMYTTEIYDYYNENKLDILKFVGFVYLIYFLYLNRNIQFFISNYVEDIKPVKTIIYKMSPVIRKRRRSQRRKRRCTQCGSVNTTLWRENNLCDYCWYK